MSFKKPYLKNMLILALLAGLLSPCYLHAATEPAVDQQIISAVLKSLARAFIATADIEKIKRENIAKIERMRQDKFEVRRAKIMQAVKDMPAPIKEKYLLSENMSKDDAIMAIYLLDKKRLYEIIDAAPDAMLARLFKEHVSRTSQQIQSSQLAVQIRKIWDNFINNTIAAPRHSK